MYLLLQYNNKYLLRVECCLSEKKIPNILKHLKFILILIISYITTTRTYVQ